MPGLKIAKGKHRENDTCYLEGLSIKMLTFLYLMTRYKNFFDPKRITNKDVSFGSALGCRIIEV